MLSPYFWTKPDNVNRLLLLTFLCASLILACTPEPTEAPVELVPGNDISGVAIPITLNHDTTEIFLTDFFTDLGAVREVSINGQAQIWGDAGQISFFGNLDSPVGVMSVNHAGTMYDIPVLASSKTEYTHTYIPTSLAVKSVQLAGNVNGWNPSASNFEKVDEGWQLSFWLAPGVYQYQMVEDGAWMLDANNPNQMSNGMGGFNSTFIVGNPEAKKPFIHAEVDDNQIEVFLPEKEMDVIVLWDNHQVEYNRAEDDRSLTIDLPSTAAQTGRSFVRVWASNDLKSNDLLIPLEKGVPITDAAELSRHDRQAMIMYFLMVDRFKDGDPANTLPVENDSILPKANHFGGDFAGITEAIDNQYFNELGVNTIWISPITQNAEGAWGLWNKGVTSKFSGYHGYWPISSTAIDYHFGDDASFRQMIDQAHSSDLNMLVDYVANHVHIEHPVYQQHSDWATELYLPDGTMNTEKWDEHRLTTWFDTHLPTLDFSRQEVIDAMTDSALFWVENYDLDGFRHDATKHIQKEFWRTLTSKIKAENKAAGKTPMFQIGETYGNPELISGYIGSGQLDSQFDFNLYDAAVDAFAKEGSGYSNLNRVLNESLDWYGSHHLMGNITGNQDRARFISYADGSVKFSEDPKLAGWTREINNNGPIGYYRLERLMAFLMTAPGIPCIYYGDEIGMPGANDPDNRRMMVFDSLQNNQAQMLANTQELIKLRNEHMALLYGDLRTIKASDDGFCFLRKYLDEIVVVVFQDPGTTKKYTVPDVWDWGLQPQFGSKVNQSAKEMFFEVTMGEKGFEILLPK
jgi:cyclomaltodextrinase